MRLLLRNASSPSPLRVRVCLACAAAGLAIWVGADLLPGSFLAAVMRTLGVACVVAITVWRAVQARRSFVQRQRDEQAAQTLEFVRLDAMQLGSALLEIHAVQWATASGQRVWAVDVMTGAVLDHWLPDPTRPLGSLVLVRQHAGQPQQIVACLDQAALAAAHRHLKAQAETAGAGTQSVVQEAELLLRGQASRRRNGPPEPGC